MDEGGEVRVEGARVSDEEGEVRGAVRMDEGSCMKQERGGMKEDGLVSWR